MHAELAIVSAVPVSRDNACTHCESTIETYCNTADPEISDTVLEQNLNVRFWEWSAGRPFHCGQGFHWGQLMPKESLGGFGRQGPGVAGDRVSVSQTTLAPPLLAHPRGRRVAASRLALRLVAQIRSAGPQERTFKDCPNTIRPNPSHL